MSKSARNHNSLTAPLRESSHLHFMQTESRYFHWLVTTCVYWSNPATVVYDSFFAWENKKRRSIFFLMHLRNPKIKTPLAESVSHKKSKCALAHIHVRRRHRTLCVCHCFPPSTHERSWWCNMALAMEALLCASLAKKSRSEYEHKTWCDVI